MRSCAIPTVEERYYRPSWLAAIGDLTGPARSRASSSNFPVWLSPSPGDPYREFDTERVANSVADSPILRDKCVVIVEDEGLTLMQLKKICLLAGMHVVGTAADGQRGVELVLKTRPHMVLLDIKMPILDGFAALELMLKEVSACVLMLTAYDLLDYKERALSLGATGYILKPVTAATLIPQLEAAYREYQRDPDTQN